MYIFFGVEASRVVVRRDPSIIQFCSNCLSRASSVAEISSTFVSIAALCLLSFKCQRSTTRIKSQFPYFDHARHLS